MTLPCRYKVYACAHPETYKYYVEREKIKSVWKTLQEKYGKARKDGSFGILEIRTERLMIKATLGGNPITLIRRRKCTEKDVEEFHQWIGFNEQLHPTL